MATGAAVEAEKTGFWAGLKNSLYKNFIQEDRWRMILSGLGVTFVISIFSALPDDRCSLSFDALCREDGSECEAVIRWKGKEFDPLTQGDELSTALALSRTRSSAHAYADGVNTITIVF